MPVFLSSPIPRSATALGATDGVDARADARTVSRPARCLSLIRGFAWVLLLALAPGGLVATGLGAPTADQIQFFETRIRPILAENCYECHGSRTSHAALRLDNQTDLLRGADTGKVVIPGDPEQSRLLQAVRHQEGVAAMPKEGRRLTEAEIAALEQWIAMGAPWPQDQGAETNAGAPEQHWAYRPVERPTVPQPDDQRWAGHPVDSFLWQAWQQQGLQPAGPADPETAARRAWYVLTGLAPSAGELQAFLADPGETQWSQLIESLLERPQYGERWARHWLDVARYADTMGYLAGDRDNRYPFAFTYRDWVIDAFNNDLPWHEFIRRQLAADQLIERGEAETGDLAALGFITVGPQLGGVETIDDRIDVVTRGFMGLTVSCARCHDHKTEPISIEDYYALYAVFDSTVEPDPLPLIGQPEPGPEIEDFERSAAEIQLNIDAQWHEIRSQMREPDIVRGYLELAWLAWQENWNGDQISTRSAAKGRYRRNAVRAWADWMKGFSEGDQTHPAMQLWAAAMKAADEDRLGAWLDETGEPEQAQARELWQRLREPRVENRAQLIDHLAELLLAASESALAARAGDPDVVLQGWQTVATWHDNPLAVPWHEIHRFADVQDRNEANRREAPLNQLHADHPGAPPRAMAVHDRDQPRNGVVFLRGDPNRRGDQVERRWPGFFGGDKFPADHSGRLEMAELIASPDNPLTARVIVNRVWAQHFGSPLVDSPSDFGMQTPAPPLLPLLDYLAAWFIDNGMSIKRLNHFIMTSQAFRLAAEGPAANEEIDGANLYHWRANRRRLDLESMRDRIIQASGALDLELLGGRSVRLERPEADRRRSLYAFIDRHDLLPMLRVFDLPNPDQHSPVRFETAGPQQALFFLNSDFVIRQAQRLATEPELLNAPDFEARVDWLHRRLFSRPAGTDDIELAREFFAAAGGDLLWQRQRGYWQPLMAELIMGDDGSVTLQHEQAPPHFIDHRWQAELELDQGPLAYWHAAADRGHPHPQRAVVLRWTAEDTRQVRLRGWVKRPSENGNGLRVIVRADGKTWQNDHLQPEGRVELTNEPILVKAGEHLELIIDSGGDANSDSFEWDVSLLMGPGHDRQPEGTLVTAWALDYPTPQGLPAITPDMESPWIDYIQALLATNEFAFID